MNYKTIFAELLLQRYWSFLDWARTNDIQPKQISLPSEVWGFVYRSRLGSYYVIINKNLTRELQQEVFMHEVEHILNDFPALPYIIGLNMQYSYIEKEADEIGKLMASGK